MTEEFTQRREVSFSVEKVRIIEGRFERFGTYQMVTFETLLDKQDPVE